MTEPLESILKIYKDKNKVFRVYLDDKTLKKLDNKLFYQEKHSDIYLNDNITFLKKNTGKIFKMGKVISIDNSRITIKTSNNLVTLDANEYYLFIKQRKNKTTNRDFYKVLFNNL